MWVGSGHWCLAALLLLTWTSAAMADEAETPKTESRPDHLESAHRHRDSPEAYPAAPALPEGMSLDAVLESSNQPPPEDFPDPVPDDALRYFLLIEQLEYRFQDGGKDQLGWEGHGWLGFDYDKLWLKLEGESVFDGRDEGESETDLLYSRMITPFWNAQIGVQYANAWKSGDYEDRWSAAIALEGLAPGMFELDSSLYLSEDGDLTAAIEGEYDLRLTQRLVLQPRVELNFSAQDVSERDLGAGMTDADLDLRLRYEVKREFAPYVGVRYRILVGKTGDRAKASGRDDDEFLVLAGLRFAF